MHRLTRYLKTHDRVRILVVAGVSLTVVFSTIHAGEAIGLLCIVIVDHCHDEYLRRRGKR